MVVLLLPFVCLCTQIRKEQRAPSYSYVAFFLSFRFPPSTVAFGKLNSHARTITRPWGREGAEKGGKLAKVFARAFQRPFQCKLEIQYIFFKIGCIAFSLNSKRETLLSNTAKCNFITWFFVFPFAWIYEVRCMKLCSFNMFVSHSSVTVTGYFWLSLFSLGQVKRSFG